MSTRAQRPELAVLISFSGDGGVERMVLNLLRRFPELGCPTDLLTLKTEGGHFRAVPDSVRHVPLGTRHASTSVPALVKYLRRERPRALLAAKDRAGRAALLARRLAGVDTRVYVRLGNTLSASLAGAPALKRWARYAPIRRLYPWADGLIAVSDGVATDVHETSGVARERIHVVRNPVLTDTIEDLAQETVDHPWLSTERDEPVILAMGRLTKQKDFPTLLRAFATLQASRHARLIILGEGPDRDALEEQAQQLGLADRISMPGFQDNPYPWLRQADLFTLSSAWEGSPNALTEALALGCPSVSTDCPSGPREILDGGRYGPLVPVGDAEAMAAAMDTSLRAPLPGDTLREAVAGYRDMASASAYLRVMALRDETTTTPAG
ncbi:glycosyltransferase [Aquisalimonas sp.]|uniref:glycosyltransferase n=1 Tax=Aquisalimonas sp. TaxID=1872621 RepID=UPI0025C07875|nr:glycosyltransferase [Aquisalimonas sp.]